MDSITDKQKKIFDVMKEKFGYTNVMQTPKIEKVVISVGVGSTKDKKRIEMIGEKLALITGQKPSASIAKKSIAQFKLREGEMIGYKVTLRGARMNGFIDKLVDIALPRTRDFRGLSVAAIDEMGNYTLGIKENTVFPETADEDLRDVFGMAITVVTSASTSAETEAYLRGLGFPFSKEAPSSEEPAE